MLSESNSESPYNYSQLSPVADNPRRRGLPPQLGPFAAPSFEWMNQNRAVFKDINQPEMPRRLPPSSRSADLIFEPFRDHMHTIKGNTALVLDDETSINMGKVDIDTAFGMLRRVEYPNGFVTYIVDGKPEIEMIRLLDGRIIVLHPPPPLSHPPTNFIANFLRKRSNKIFPFPPSGGRRRRRRTIARKMGKNGTNKRRCRCMNHTRRK